VTVDSAAEPEPASPARGAPHAVHIHLNTAVDALAVIVFGLALASGVLGGESDPLLTILPAALVAAAVAAVVLALPRLSSAARRDPLKHPKIATAIATLADAVEDTKRLLLHRGIAYAVLRRQFGAVPTSDAGDSQGDR